MRKIDRLSKYMDFKGLNDNVVTKECSLSQGLLSQARTGKCDLGNKAIDKILSIYQDLSKVWLLTGEGEMLKQNNVVTPSEDATLIEQLIESLKTVIETQKLLIDAQRDEIERLQRALFEKEAK